MRQIAVRLPTNLIDEIDAEVEAMSQSPLVRAERSALMRELLKWGLETLRAKKKKGPDAMTAAALTLASGALALAIGLRLGSSS